MRERLKRSGFDSYRPHEVLEQLLFDCVPRENTNPIGHRLINRFGSVMAVLDAKVDELCEIEGIGRKSAEYIASVKPTIGRMICEQYRTMEPVTKEMAEFLADWFMSGENGRIGLIKCDTSGVFEDFCFITHAEPLVDDSSIENLCAEITKTADGGKYILVFSGSEDVPRSAAYKILDSTSKDGVYMINAYKADGTELVSLIF